MKIQPTSAIVEVTGLTGTLSIMLDIIEDNNVRIIVVTGLNLDESLDKKVLNVLIDKHPLIYEATPALFKTKDGFVSGTCAKCRPLGLSNLQTIAQEIAVRLLEIIGVKSEWPPIMSYYYSQTVIIQDQEIDPFWSPGRLRVKTQFPCPLDVLSEVDITLDPHTALFSRSLQIAKATDEELRELLRATLEKFLKENMPLLPEDPVKLVLEPIPSIHIKVTHAWNCLLPQVFINALVQEIMDATKAKWPLKSK